MLIKNYEKNVLVVEKKTFAQLRSVEQLVRTVKIGTIFETVYVGINNWDLETYRKRKVTN